MKKKKKESNQRKKKKNIYILSTISLYALAYKPIALAMVIV